MTVKNASSVCYTVILQTDKTPVTLRYPIHALLLNYS